MTYLPEESVVMDKSEGGKEEKTLGALDWLAAMTSHALQKRVTISFMNSMLHVERRKLRHSRRRL